MECFTNSISEVHTDESFETFVRSKLTQKISKTALKNIQLKYIPDYLRKLRNKKDYWENEYRKYQDDMSSKKWRSYHKKFNVELKKHKTILKNLDVMRRVFVYPYDSNHFSQSLDPERVQAIVDYLKDNQSDDNIFYRFTAVTGQNKDFDHFFYVTYAIWALYGDFRVRPPGSTAVQVKKNSLF